MIANVDRLIKVSETKEELLSKFFELTKTQNDLIKSEDFDQFDDILEEKERLIGEIDGLDVEFIELYEGFKKEANVESIEDIDASEYPNLKDLKKTISNLSNLLREVDLLDKSNMALMKKSFSEVKLDLKNAKTNKLAHRGYNQNPVGSIMIDEKK